MNNKILKKVIAVLCAATISTCTVASVGAMPTIDIAEAYYTANNDQSRTEILNQYIIPNVNKLQTVFNQHNIRIFDTETDYSDPMYWEGCLNFISRLSVDDMNSIADYIVNQTGDLVPRYFDVYCHATVTHNGPYTIVSCSPLTMLDLIRNAIQTDRVNILSETRKKELRTLCAIQ